MDRKQGKIIRKRLDSHNTAVECFNDRGEFVVRLLVDHPSDIISLAPMYDEMAADIAAERGWQGASS